MTSEFTDVFDCRSLSDLLRHPLSNEEHAAVFVARDAHGTLKPRDVMAQLDALAEGFEVERAHELDPYEQAAALLHHVTIRHGFSGSDKSYHDAESSYLDSVLKRKQGIPISLAVVYLAVARRVNIPAYGIGFPGHFLVRVGDVGGVYLDPFEGRVLTPPVLGALLMRFLGPGSEMKDEYLAPVSASQLTQRMLLNLKRLHETQRDYARAMLACDRLVELAPTPELRRDRGLCALKLGANKVAGADLAHYLLKRPNAKDVKEVRAALAKSRKSTAPLN